MKRYLQCRNCGLCMAHNRLLGYRVVRSTVPTLFLWPQFTVDPATRMARGEEHLAKAARYPDKHHYMNQVQKFFFRNEELRYLRLGQFFRYLTHSSEEAPGRAPTLLTQENTMAPLDEARVPDDPTHRHYDHRVSRQVAPGEKWPCCASLGISSEAAVRRQNSNFLVPRSAFLEPLGGGREAFYEQRLLFGLPWHCPEPPSFQGVPPHTKGRWTFETGAPHTPEALQRFSMVDRVVEDNKTMEEMCVAFERAYASQGKCCPCCENLGSQCATCSHALGWHVCDKDVATLRLEVPLEEREEVTAEARWRAGTLHNGRLDVEGTLWTLARRLVPLVVLKEKLKKYIEEHQLDETEYDRYVEVFEQMQGVVREQNVFADPAVASAAATEEANRPMSDAELREELARREKLMQTRAEKEGAATDQWRVYTEIVEALTSNSDPLRYFLQASAGTGKSFLLETLYLWCVVTRAAGRRPVPLPSGVCMFAVLHPRQ